jgi:hypothetical protein
MVLPHRMTHMAPPLSSTALAKTTRAAVLRKSPKQSGNKTSPMRAGAAIKKSCSLSATDRQQAAEMLQELRIDGEALTAQIARLAHRFL